MNRSSREIAERVLAIRSRLSAIPGRAYGHFGMGHDDGTHFIVLPHNGTEGPYGVAPVFNHGDEISESPFYSVSTFEGAINPNDQSAAWALAEFIANAPDDIEWLLKVVRDIVQEREASV